MDKWPCSPCLLILHTPMRIICSQLRIPKDRLLWLNHVYGYGRSLDQARAITARANAHARSHKLGSIKPESAERRSNRLASIARYYAANREAIIAKKVRRKQERALVDATIPIKTHLRNTIRRMVRLGAVKQRSSSLYVGCTCEELRAHLSMQFTPAMTWANYGRVWEVDHIHPLSSFNLAIDAEALKAAHYSNLRPMLVPDNRAKWAKLRFDRQMELV